jgi:uncharacterized protein
MTAGARWTIRSLRSRLALVGVAVAVLIVPLGTSVSAQELIRRQGVLERLFGRGPPPREALPPAPDRPRGILRQRRQYVEPPPQPQQQQRARRAAPPAAAAAPARRQQQARQQEPAVEKLENALVVLVVGDFLAGGLAEGLEEAYAKSPGVRIVDRSNGSSGFVRDDYYDWNSSIGEILEQEKPALVVVMIGSNDRQPLTIDGRAERPQTEPWLTEYVQRVTRFAETVKDAGLPLVWTGVPPFKSPSMSSDMLAFNDIYKRTAESVGGTFVDIWEGFVDENGAFTATGPDMNGQPVRLRGNDGINLTRPAKRKVAFYAEKPLGKILGPAASPDAGQQEISALPQPGAPAEAPADLTRTRPLSLASPEPDGGALLGASARPAATAPERSAPSTQPGRADHFSLRTEPAPETESPTQPGP